MARRTGRMSRVIEKEEDTYISDYTLDRIEAEVCKSIDCMKYSRWKDVISTCIEIEREPLSIYTYLDTVITVSTAGKSFASQSHLNEYKRSITTRVYILLYYYHRDDEVYKLAVFPPLWKRIRQYSANYNIEGIIDKPIDRIIELENKVKELQGQLDDEPAEDNQKSRKGKFTTTQAALFCEAFLRFGKCSFTNKKETVPPIAGKMFGWELSSLERNMVYNKKDKENVAKVFDEIYPEFSEFVRSLK